MNRNISNYYSKLIDDGSLEKRDVYDALMAGIRNGDKALVEKSLKILPPADEWDNNDYPYPAEFAINEMASNEVITLLSDKGFIFDDFPPRLSLFDFTPKEMVSFYKNNYPNKGNPYEEIFIHITYYLDVYKEGMSCFRVPFNIDEEDKYKPYFSSYIDSWCCDFIDVVTKETRGKVKDKIIWGFFQSSVKDPDLKKLFNKTKELIKEDKLHEYIEHGLNLAINFENEPAFDYLLSQIDLDQLCISTYPRNNMNILEKILGINQLIPGKDESFKAFLDYVMFGEINEEILSRINHPSYSKKQDKEGRTPLMIAVSNEDFLPSDYNLLFSDKSDLEIKDKKGNTALLIAAKNNPNVLEDLIEIGANPSAKNNCGNNALHIMAKKKEFLDIQFAIEVLPLSLLEDRNLRGFTPMDEIRERIIKRIDE